MRINFTLLPYAPKSRHPASSATSTRMFGGDDEADAEFGCAAAPSPKNTPTARTNVLTRTEDLRDTEIDVPNPQQTRGISATRLGAGLIVISQELDEVSHALLT